MGLKYWRDPRAHTYLWLCQLNENKQLHPAHFSILGMGSYAVAVHKSLKAHGSQFKRRLSRSRHGENHNFYCKDREKNCLH